MSLQGESARRRAVRARLVGTIDGAGPDARVTGCEGGSTRRTRPRSRHELLGCNDPARTLPWSGMPVGGRLDALRRLARRAHTTALIARGPSPVHVSTRASAAAAARGRRRVRRPRSRILAAHLPRRLCRGVAKLHVAGCGRRTPRGRDAAGRSLGRARRRSADADAEAARSRGMGGPRSGGNTPLVPPPSAALVPRTGAAGENAAIGTAGRL